MIERYIVSRMSIGELRKVYQWIGTDLDWADDCRLDYEVLVKLRAIGGDDFEEFCQNVSQIQASRDHRVWNKADPDKEQFLLYQPGDYVEASRFLWDK